MSEAPQNPDPSNQPAPSGVVNIRADALVETPPEPSAHVVNRPAAEPVTPAPTPEAAPKASGKPAAVLPPRVDRRGVAFDPQRHLDRLHPVSGNWMPKKPKRAPVVSSVGSARHEPNRSRSTVGPDPGDAPEKPEPEPDGPDVDLPDDKFRGAALGACTVLYASGMTIGGDEWRPTDDEHANLMQTFEAYFRAKGIVDLSPGWALAIALVAYAGPRFRQPKTVSTLTKIGGIFQRFGVWWKARSVARSLPKS